jgi:hypothetical protein
VGVLLLVASHVAACVGGGRVGEWVGEGGRGGVGWGGRGVFSLVVVCGGQDGEDDEKREIEVQTAL